MTAGVPSVPSLSADVLGLGCVLPGASDCAQFAELLANHVALPTPQRQELFGGMATGIFRPAYDWPAFKNAVDQIQMSGAVAEQMLRAGRRGSATLRATLLAAAQAWSDAGQLQGETVGVILAGNNFDPGAGHAALRDFDQDGFVSPIRGVNWLDGHLLGTVSEVFGLTGPGFQIGGSSAAGLMGLLQAALFIRVGFAHNWLIVAPPMILSSVELNAFASLGTLATVGEDEPLPQPFPTPFDANTQGFVPAECAAAVMLGPGSGHRFQITGGASVMDGHSRAEPNPSGEARAMRAALASAGLRPEQVGYLNTHGTGSQRGDTVEALAISEVFGGVGPAINATKGLVGHGLTSAGLVEVVATCLQLRTGLLHANPGLRQPISQLLDFIGDRSRPANVRHALCNSLAFGGVNAAAIITDTHWENT